jgi:hypothetical protein
MDGKLNDPPPSPPLQPLRPCWNPRGHDFSMRQRNGLVYCWYCVQLSPRSRERLAADDAETREA